jgi:hypothetical protein
MQQVQTLQPYISSQPEEMRIESVDLIFIDFLNWKFAKLYTSMEFSLTSSSLETKALTAETDRLIFSDLDSLES